MTTGAAEQQNVILSDEQIAVLKNPRDLTLAGMKGSAGTHLVDTQSISGAGARGMAISGSAALTNLDFNTSARVGKDKVIIDPNSDRYKVNKDDKKYQVDISEYQVNGQWISPEHETKYNAAVAEKQKQYEQDVQNAIAQLSKDIANAQVTNRDVISGTLNIAGDLRVEADGSRFVNNVASASMNGKGGASANASAAEAANADVGDSNSAQTVTEGENFSVTVTKGAAAQIDGTDKKKVLITLSPGFKLKAEEDSADCFAVCSYNDQKSGTEKTEKIKVETDADGKLFFIDG